MAQTHSHSSNVTPAAVKVSGPVPDVDVGEVLRRMDAGRELGDQELEQHISDCNTLWTQAYARFQEHANPADRDEAVLWLYRRDKAMALRRQEVKDAREAEIQRAIAQDSGCYFVDQGERDRAALGSRG